MSKNEFSLAFNEVLEEKQLSKDVILNAIESAMVSAYRRAVNASTAQHVEAKIDADTGKVMVFAEKEVVEDILEPKTEVLLEEARKVNPEAQLGDMVVVETTPSDFGRAHRLRVRSSNSASGKPSVRIRCSILSVRWVKS
jgi:N utilization substance protein A